MDTRLSGFFFGRDPEEKIDTRRATPKCRGVYVCSAIDQTFVKTPRRTLDLGPRADGEACAGDAATARAAGRHSGWAGSYVRLRASRSPYYNSPAGSFTPAIKKVHCRGVRSNGTRCPGTVSAVRRLHEVSRFPFFGSNTHCLAAYKRQSSRTPVHRSPHAACSRFLPLV